MRRTIVGFLFLVPMLAFAEPQYQYLSCSLYGVKAGDPEGSSQREIATTGKVAIGPTDTVQVNAYGAKLVGNRENPVYATISLKALAPSQFQLDLAISEHSGRGYEARTFTMDTQKPGDVFSEYPFIVINTLKDQRIDCEFIRR